MDGVEIGRDVQRYLGVCSRGWVGGVGGKRMSVGEQRGCEKGQETREWSTGWIKVDDGL